MKKLEMTYEYVRATKTCAVYSTGSRDTSDLQTLYIKKDKLAEAGIREGKPVKVTVEEA